jgi:hypothetical protein
MDREFAQKARECSLNYYNANLRRRIPKSTVIEDGILYHTISSLSKAINRKCQTIREYHELGIIPLTQRNENEWRLYTIQRFEVIREAFYKFDMRELTTLTEVKQYIHERW